MPKRIDSKENLIKLLSIEQELALRKSPFKCTEVECPRFNRSVHSGDCACYEIMARAHREEVRAILAKVKGEQ